MGVGVSLCGYVVVVIAPTAYINTYFVLSPSFWGVLTSGGVGTLGWHAICWVLGRALPFELNRSRSG